MSLLYLRLQLAANLAGVVVFHSTAGRLVAAIGAMTASLLLFGPAVLPRWFSTSERPAERTRTRWETLSLVLLVVVPFASLIIRTRLAFWRVDARGLIVVSWLVGLWMASRSQGAVHAPSTRRGVADPFTICFIVWASLFWLTVIWDVGIGRLVLTLARPDRLLWSFDIWETHAATEHLFLIWYNPEQFARHQVYTNHLHPYLFSLYGLTKLGQLVTGFPMYVGRNLTPFAIITLGLTAVVAVVGRAVTAPRTGTTRYHATLFLALGVFLTNWQYWVALYTINFDNVFPIIAFLAVIVWACAQPRVSRDNAAIVVGSAILFAALGWIYTPLIVLAIIVYFGRDAMRTVEAKRVLIGTVVAALVLGTSVYALPRLLAALKGYTLESSSFMFRSGLDGDAQYFQNVAQAVFEPLIATWRTRWGVAAACLPLLLCVWWGPWRGRIGRRRLLGPLVFVTSPYVFSAAIFPQSVSIHPYLYDHLFVQPILILGVAGTLSASFQRRLRGPYLLLALLLVAIVLMSNLVSIAQAVRKMTLA